MEKASYSPADLLHPTRIFWKLRQNRSYRQVKPLLPRSLESSLDLGSGPQPQNPFGAREVFGIDFAENSEANVLAVDLALQPIPFPDNSLDAVTAFDFVEHVPRVSLHNGKTIFPFINVMNEIFRVLAPGGLFWSVTPAYPAAEAFQDPTHVNIITKMTFPLYFCDDRWASAYGFTGNFALLHQSRIRAHLYTLMRKKAGENLKPDESSQQ